MSRRRALIAAALVLVLVGGAVAAWQVYERRHPPDVHGSATCRSRVPARAAPAPPR